MEDSAKTLKFSPGDVVEYADGKLYHRVLILSYDASKTESFHRAFYMNEDCEAYQVLWLMEIDPLWPNADLETKKTDWVYLPEFAHRYRVMIGI